MSASPGVDVWASGDAYESYMGRWSRLVSLLLGSPWAYAQLPELSPAAEGQFTTTEMRMLLSQLAPATKEDAPQRRRGRRENIELERKLDDSSEI